MNRKKFKRPPWKGEFFQNYSFLSLQPVINFIGQLMLVPFYVNLLGLEKVGLLFSIMVISNVFLGLLDFNLLVPMTRIYREHTDKHRALGSFLAFKLALFTMSSLTLSSWLLVFETDRFTRLAYYLFLFSGFLNPFQFEFLFLANNRVKEIGMLKGAASLFSLCATFATVYLWPSILTIPMTATLIFSGFMIYILYNYRSFFHFRLNWELPIFRKILKESFPLALMQLSAPFGLYYGVVAIQKFSPVPELAGPYGIGQKMALSILMLAHPLVIVMVNKIIHTGSFDGILKNIWKFALATIGLFLLIWGVAPYLFSLMFSEKIQGEVINMKIVLLVFNFYLATVALLYLRSPFASLLLAKGKTLLFSLCHIIPIFICIWFIFHFAKTGNLLGVVISCASSEILTSLIFFVIGLYVVKFKKLGLL